MGKVHFNETACGSMYHGRILHTVSGLVPGYHSYLATARALGISTDISITVALKSCM